MPQRISKKYTRNKHFKHTLISKFTDAYNSIFMCKSSYCF